MEHSDRHEDEIVNRHLARVVGEVRSVAEACAIVVSGSESLRSAFLRLLDSRLPTAEIDRNPDDKGSVVASRIAEAAATAVQARRMSEVRAALATGAAVTDWATVVAEADGGRLHEIWMDSSLALHVYRCESCTSLVEGSNACSQCGADAWNRLPLPEVIVRLAARTGAALHFTELSSSSGLGGTGIVAVSRY